MKKGKCFLCVFKNKEVILGVLKDGTEICLAKIVCGCDNWGCSYIKTFHNLHVEQLDEISPTELAEILS